MKPNPICPVHLKPMKAHKQTLPGFAQYSSGDECKNRGFERIYYRCAIAGCPRVHAGEQQKLFDYAAEVTSNNYWDKL